VWICIPSLQSTSIATVAVVASPANCIRVSYSAGSISAEDQPVSRKDLHPSVRRRLGEAIEAMFVWGAGIAIWFAVISVLVSAIVQLS
jgi:hypothetical protein